MSQKPLTQLSFPERLNFLLTNRIPRRSLTLFMGWFSKLENRWLARLSIAIWQLFADDLRLFEARKREFASLHDCFVRELEAGARPVDPAPEALVSPCDAIVGAFGDVAGLEVIQAKGFPYQLDELLGDAALAERYRDGRFVTLRLKSSMYHRFHAPLAGRTRCVHYISGDTWNVNPVALKVVERLYCRNERVVVELQTDAGPVLLVPVAAVLVASMRLKDLDVALNLRFRGANRISWVHGFSKGEEMGYFEHGSTIVVLTSRRFEFDPSLQNGSIIRMGQRLMRCADLVSFPSHAT